MRVPRATICVLIMALACLGVARPAIADPAPSIIVDPPLRPLSLPAPAELAAYTCTATVECAGEECAIRTAQRYHFSLPEGVAAAALRVGLPSEALDQPISATEIALLDEQGVALPTIAPPADMLAAWEIPMERGRRRTLELSYRHPAGADAILIWSWEVAALSAWGAVPAVHGEFVLPQPAHDDALIRVDPHRANLLGPRLWWDYERATEYPPHRVVVVAPPVWDRLQARRAEGAHGEVAAILTDLQAAATAKSIPGIDYGPEIVAELLAALEANPADTAIRVNLADTYRALAERSAEHRLSYLTLAARELTAALEATESAADPDAQALATVLGRTYLVAAETASATGDPAAALEYLGLARETAGHFLAEELAHADELTLHWALKLAEQGHVAEALAQLDGLLAATLHDNLLHFAPPLVAARTEVSLRPSARTVHYDLDLYPPTAPRVRERLNALVQRLHETPCCEATLEGDDTALELTVRAPAQDVAALEACRRDIDAALSVEEGLAAALVALPWRAGPSAYAVESDLWREHHRYAEALDTTALDALWRSEAEYAGWRLVELNSATPADARALLEQQLALAIIREQRHTWEAIPSSSQWVYEVAFADAGPPSAAWLVAWGQNRSLTVDRSYPRWGEIRTAALGVVALLAAPLLVRRLWRAILSR